jgi:hypothetical protein
LSILKKRRRFRRQGYSPFGHQPSGINAAESHLPGERPASWHHIERPSRPDRARDPRAITYGMYNLPRRAKRRLGAEPPTRLGADTRLSSMMPKNFLKG